MQPQQYSQQPMQAPVPQMTSVPPAHNHKKSLIIVSVIAVVLFVVFVGTLVQYLSVSSDVDGQLSEARAQAATEAREVALNEAAEAAKNPFQPYQTPSVVAGVTLHYPRTWSAYIEESESSSTQVNFFANPKSVSGNKTATHALRMEIEKDLYTDVVSSYNRSVENGELIAKAIKVSGITGLRLDGEIESGVSGAIVLLPIRDKTLIIWTETNNHLADFAKILAELDVTT